MANNTRQIKILFGQQGAGKTTYVQEHKDDFSGYTIISVDEIWDKTRAEAEIELGKSVSSADKIKYINAKAAETANKILEQAATDGDNILIDSTTLTREECQNIIKSVNIKAESYTYISTAIVIHAPTENEHAKRLFNRLVKTGDSESINSLNCSPSIRSFNEHEFDHVEYVGTPPKSPFLHEYQATTSLAEAVQDAKNLGNGKRQR